MRRTMSHLFPSKNRKMGLKHQRAYNFFDMFEELSEVEILKLLPKLGVSKSTAYRALEVLKKDRESMGKELKLSEQIARKLVFYEFLVRSVTGVPENIPKAWEWRIVETQQACVRFRELFNLDELGLPIKEEKG